MSSERPRRRFRMRRGWITILVVIVPHELARLLRPTTVGVNPQENSAADPNRKEQPARQPPTHERLLLGLSQAEDAPRRMQHARATMLRDGRDILNRDLHNL